MVTDSYELERLKGRGWKKNEGRKGLVEVDGVGRDEHGRSKERQTSLPVPPNHDNLEKSIRLAQGPLEGHLRVSCCSFDIRSSGRGIVKSLGRSPPQLMERVPLDVIWRRW